MKMIAVHGASLNRESSEITVVGQHYALLPVGVTQDCLIVAASQTPLTHRRDVEAVSGKGAHHFWVNVLVRKQGVTQWLHAGTLRSQIVPCSTAIAA